MAETVPHGDGFGQHVFAERVHVILVRVFQRKPAGIARIAQRAEDGGEIQGAFGELRLQRAHFCLAQVDVDGVFCQGVHLVLPISKAGEVGIVERQADTGVIDQALHQGGRFGPALHMRLDTDFRAVVAGHGQKGRQAFGAGARGIGAGLARVDDAGQQEDTFNPGGIGEGQHLIEVAGVLINRAGQGQVAPAQAIPEQMVVIREYDAEGGKAGRCSFRVRQDFSLVERRAVEQPHVQGIDAQRFRDAHAFVQRAGGEGPCGQGKFHACPPIRSNWPLRAERYRASSVSVTRAPFSALAAFVTGLPAQRAANTRTGSAPS